LSSAIISRRTFVRPIDWMRKRRRCRVRTREERSQDYMRPPWHHVRRFWLPQRALEVSCWVEFDSRGSSATMRSPRRST